MKIMATIYTLLILTNSIIMVVVVTWFVPSLSAASLNMLFRLRGELRAPDDIVILAIDDRSLQKIGQWPWPRSVMAAVLDELTKAQVGSVGLDVIYAEPSVTAEDRRLAAAIARNGRVILPAQLYEAGPAQGPASTEQRSLSSPVGWLRPLPEFADAAMAIGHAHVSPGVDGMVRSIQLSKADDRADKIWAFVIEALRVAEGVPVEEMEEQAGVLRFGRYRIPVQDEATSSAIPGISIVRQNEMLINFAGPVRSFHYYSIADLIDGIIPLSALTGKIVLIGAVAESMGDTRVVPFMHYSAERSQGGQEMPGVEIHANIINTIRSRLSFRPLPDWVAFVVAIIVILFSALTIKWLDGWRQILMLGMIFFAIVLGSFFAFSGYLIIPPLVPMLTGFIAVIPLLLNRSLAAGRELDVKLAALVGSQIGVVALISDITKRVELDRMKTETLQLVSHELRTPLTSIQGLSSALIKFPVNAEVANEMLGTIHSEAIRLGETINRYLDLTRLESGAQRLHLAPVSCSKLIEDCIRNLAVFAAERRIQLTSQIGSGLPTLQADEQLMTQAVRNLLSNAIKYSPPGSEVVVTAGLNRHTIRLTVRDQGFGIPEEAQEKIFEKFYRLERDSASTVVGTGLGLPLVKEIVERHGGRVTIESAPLIGSTFTIHLPLRPPAFSIVEKQS